MSNWYDFALACTLKPDTPQQVIDTLTFMTRTEDYAFTNPPDHPYFQSEYWCDFLQPHDAIEDFAGDFRCFFRITEVKHFPGNFIGSMQKSYHYMLSIRRCMIDDEFGGSAWWEFASWLAQYSKTEGFVGYFKCEFYWKPTLLYFKHGAAYYQEIEGLPKPITPDAPEW